MKKIVKVSATRTYFKTTEIEVEVDDNLVDDELVNFLTNDEVINNRLEEGIDQATLNGGDTEYRYDDTKEKIGGHL